MRFRNDEMMIVARNLIAAGEGMARLAALGKDGQGEWFSTEDLPPGVSRRTFREVARRIEGRVRDGQHLRVRCEDWYRARERRAPLPAANGEAPIDVSAVLKVNGLRLTQQVDKSPKRRT